MKSGTKDNIIDLIKNIEEQKLEYVLAIWNDTSKDKIDEATVYTSFSKGHLKKLIEVLKEAVRTKS